MLSKNKRCVATFLLAVRRCSSLQPSATAFQRDGVAFVSEFLPPAVFARICDDIRSVRGGMKLEKDSIAVGRLGRYVDSRSEAHDCLTSDAVIQRVSRLVGAPVEPSEYPIELRSYRAGSGMEWHQDDLLYDLPQCELVICIDNSSDSRTEWIDAGGELHAEWTPPNSALLVRAGETGAKHRVQSLKRGERTIIKSVWTTAEAKALESFYQHIDSFPGLRNKERRPKAAAKARRGGNNKR